MQEICWKTIAEWSVDGVQHRCPTVKSWRFCCISISVHSAISSTTTCSLLRVRWSLIFRKLCRTTALWSWKAACDGIQLVTGLRVNMRNKLMPFYDRMMLRKRYIIETINDMLKNTAQIVHSRHRSVSNFIMNLISALGAYCFFDNKPKTLQGYCIEDTKQLTLF